MKHKDLQRFLFLFYPVIPARKNHERNGGISKNMEWGIHSHIVEERINCNCKGPHMPSF